MTAYFVAVRTGISDPAEMKTYRAKSAEARVGHAVTALAAYGKLRSTDGPATDGAVILAFPTFEEAEAWYDSEAYQAALPHREKGGQFQTFIIQGLD